MNFDKIWLFSALAALPKAAFLDREGQPEGGVCVQNSIEDVSDRVGNPHSRFGDDEGVERAGVVVEWRSCGAGSGWGTWLAPGWASGETTASFGSPDCGCLRSDSAA